MIMGNILTIEIFDKNILSTRYIFLKSCSNMSILFILIFFGIILTFVKWSFSFSYSFWYYLKIFIFLFIWNLFAQAVQLFLTSFIIHNKMW